NLMINASEALHEKRGTITIGISRATHIHDVESGTPVGSRGEYVRLEVSDTGCGMTEEQRAKIFDPYFTTKRTGHGLGLAVVQGIVRSHGGSIRVITNPGKGTTFEVLLPVIQRRGGPASATARTLRVSSAGHG